MYQFGDRDAFVVAVALVDSRVKCANINGLQIDREIEVRLQEILGFIQEVVPSADVLAAILIIESALMYDSRIPVVLLDLTFAPCVNLLDELARVLLHPFAAFECCAQSCSLVFIQCIKREIYDYLQRRIKPLIMVGISNVDSIGIGDHWQICLVIIVPLWTKHVFVQHIK